MDMDGVLSYNGEVKITRKMFGYPGKEKLTAIKGEAGNLTYRKAILLEGGKKAVKPIKLVCGTWKLKKTGKGDEADYDIVAVPGNCDYCIDGDGEDPGVLTATSMEGNFDGLFPEIRSLK